MRVRQASQRLARGDAGFSLAEVLVALALLVVAVLGVSGGLASALVAVGNAKDRQRAVEAGSRAIENVRALGYSDVALPTAGLSPGQAFEAELVVQAVAGKVTGAPYRFAADGLDVATWVTWYDDPLAVPQTGPDLGRDAKRVTVLVGYQDREFRQSTLVSEVTRGLAAPLFQVAPVQGSATRRTDVAEVCLPNRILNNGARDRYEIVLPSNPAYSQVRAYQDSNANGTREVSDPLLADGSGNGPGFPDTAGFVEARQSLAVLICYTRASPGTARTDTLTTRYRSLYDSQVFHDVTHRLAFDTELRLYLRDVPDDTRLPKGGSFVLDAAPPSNTTLIDFDTDGRLGKYVKKNDVNYDVGFDLVVSEAVRLGGTSATLKIYTASTQALAAAGPTTLTGPNAKTVSYTVRVQRVPAGGAAVTLASDTRSYVHNLGGFLTQNHTFNVPATNFAAGDKLRVSLHCNNNDDCHFAYDSAGAAPYSTRSTLAYPTLFKVGLQ